MRVSLRLVALGSLERLYRSISFLSPTIAPHTVPLASTESDKKRSVASTYPSARTHIPSFSTLGLCPTTSSSFVSRFPVVFNGLSKITELFSPLRDRKGRASPPSCICATQVAAPRSLEPKSLVSSSRVEWRSLI